MLMTRIDRWLATRRASGFALEGYERHLHQFAEPVRHEAAYDLRISKRMRSRDELVIVGHPNGGSCRQLFGIAELVATEDE